MKERPILFGAPMINAILSGAKTQTRRVMNPQPDHLQHHEWKGKLVYEGEHRMWCWKQHTYDNLWDEGCREDERRHLAAQSPYGVPGDRLWVRETWRSWTQNNCHQHEDGPEGDVGCDEHCNQTYVAYRATPRIGYRPIPDRQRICYLDEATPLEENKELLGPWNPSIFLPRAFSRIALEVTEVRVQRLQEISDEDAKAEGVEPYTPPYGHISPEQRAPGPGFDRARLGDQPHRLPFADLWDRINGKSRPMLDDGGKPVLDDNDSPITIAPRSWESNPWIWTVSFRRLQ